MTRGGRRNRGGQRPDPDSARSDKRRYSLEFLPPNGYAGEPPPFPLTEPTDRELELWAEAWRTPQACAWSMPGEQWRWRTVGMYVRLTARCEQPGTGASIMAQLHRFADQIGMTTAGLAEMGWKIAQDPRQVMGVDHGQGDDDLPELTPLRLVPEGEPGKRRLRS